MKILNKIGDIDLIEVFTYIIVIIFICLVTLLISKVRSEENVCNCYVVEIRQVQEYNDLDS